MEKINAKNKKEEILSIETCINHFERYKVKNWAEDSTLFYLKELEGFKERKITLTKDDKLKVYFEGHEFLISYDENTNENLKMRKLI